MGNKDGGRRLRTSKCRPPASHNRRAKRSHRAFVKTGNLAPAIGHAGKVAGLAQDVGCHGNCRARLDGSARALVLTHTHTHTKSRLQSVGLCI